MSEKFETLTPEELELLEKLSPQIFTAVQECQPFAEQIARTFLATKKATARNAAAPASSPSQPPSDPPPPAVQLPLWPEPARAVPNGILRSALFGAIRRGRRRYINDEEIASVRDVSIKYKGERLDQGDLDVWETILFLLRGKDLQEKCRTTSYEILRIMGKKDSGKHREILRSRISRLVANAVIIKQGRYEYIGSMVYSAARDEQTQEWMITLNPDIRSLFESDQFTQIDWDIRNELDGQLSKWLHGFYSSHAEPYPVKIETLHRLSGSECNEIWHFTEKLKKALNAVTQACAAHGERFAWSISDGLVHVSKTPTQAQRRHLAQYGK